MAGRGRGGRRGRARYAVRDWAAYDRALARRGGITVWVSPGAVAGWRAPAGRRTFSDAAIAAALTVRAVFRLALRQAEGLVGSIFALLGLALPVPDHTTLSRRGRALTLDRRLDAGRGIDLAIDSTGLSLARPAGARREGWRKLHIAVDPDTGRIPAEELTLSGVHDTRPVPAMLGRIAGRLGRVYGDGAYAGGPTHRAVAERKRPLPNAEGVFRPRAPAVRAAVRLDPLSARGRHARRVAREGRAAWERATGYGRRSAVEATFSRLKRVLGGALRSRSHEAQQAEAAVAVRALNRMAELGMPHAGRVASRGGWAPPEPGASHAPWCTRATWNHAGAGAGRAPRQSTAAARRSTTASSGR